MSELDFIWMENVLEIEQIIELMKSCDKNCRECTMDEKNDCVLEMRESIHSLALHFKDFLYGLAEMLSAFKKERGVVGGEGEAPKFGDGAQKGSIYT